MTNRSEPKKKKKMTKKKKLEDWLSLIMALNLWQVGELTFIYIYTGGSVVKNLPANTGDASLIPGSGRSPGEGNDNPLQYSCLGNPMDRGAWWEFLGLQKSQI